MSDIQQDSKDKILKILTELSEPERKLLSQVLKLEQENLHLKAPRLKADILRFVREVIK